MKKYFLLGCVLLCVVCFVVSLSILRLTPNEKDRKEPVVYRNGNIVKESLSVLDEEIVIKAQPEDSDIGIEKDITETNEENTVSYGWYGTSVYVEDLIPGTEYVVVLEYVNLKSTILEALLYEPGLARSYSKDGLSEAGKLVFPLTQEKEGEYTIVLYGTGDIGGYTTYILKRSEYENLQEPNIEYPRDRMREDALIDE